MTRQRLREGSIKWETILSLESFAQKIIKKIELLAFTDKVKIIKTYIPEKIRIYFEKNLKREIQYFEKKYSFKIEFIGDEQLIVPEYKIELFNKSKKLINKVENINHIPDLQMYKEKDNYVKKKTGKLVNLKKVRKTKISKKKKILRTLWVRRKKRA